MCCLNRIATTQQDCVVLQDREEMVILSKIKAKNKMTGDGEKKKIRKGIYFPSQGEKIKTGV